MSLMNFLVKASGFANLEQCLQLCDITNMEDIVMVSERTLSQIETYIRLRCRRLQLAERREIIGQLYDGEDSFIFPPIVKIRLISLIEKCKMLANCGFLCEEEIVEILNKSYNNMNKNSVKINNSCNLLQIEAASENILLGERKSTNQTNVSLINNEKETIDFSINKNNEKSANENKIEEFDKTSSSIGNQNCEKIDFSIINKNKNEVSLLSNENKLTNKTEPRKMVNRNRRKKLSNENLSNKSKTNSSIMIIDNENCEKMDSSIINENKVSLLSNDNQTTNELSKNKEKIKSKKIDKSTDKSKTFELSNENKVAKLTNKDKTKKSNEIKKESSLTNENAEENQLELSTLAFEKAAKKLDKIKRTKEKTPKINSSNEISILKPSSNENMFDGALHINTAEATAPAESAITPLFSKIRDEMVLNNKKSNSSNSTNENIMCFSTNKKRKFPFSNEITPSNSQSKAVEDAQFESVLKKPKLEEVAIPTESDSFSVTLNGWMNGSDDIVQSTPKPLANSETANDNVGAVSLLDTIAGEGSVTMESFYSRITGDAARFLQDCHIVPFVDFRAEVSINPDQNGRLYAHYDCLRCREIFGEERRYKFFLTKTYRPVFTNIKKHLETHFNSI